MAGMLSPTAPKPLDEQGVLYPPRKTAQAAAPMVAAATTAGSSTVASPPSGTKTSLPVANPTQGEQYGNNPPAAAPSPAINTSDVPDANLFGGKNQFTYGTPEELQARLRAPENQDPLTQRQLQDQVTQTNLISSVKGNLQSGNYGAIVDQARQAGWNDQDLLNFLNNNTELSGKFYTQDMLNNVYATNPNIARLSGAGVVGMAEKPDYLNMPIFKDVGNPQDVGHNLAATEARNAALNDLRQQYADVVGGVAASMDPKTGQWTLNGQPATADQVAAAQQRAQQYNAAYERLTSGGMLSPSAGTSTPSGGQSAPGASPSAGTPSGGPQVIGRGHGKRGQPAPGGGIYDGQGNIVSGPEGSYKSILDPNSMTVEGRLQGLLSKGNPLLDMAMTKAMQQAQANGLLNSSIAAEAGQAAVIQNALPIAQQDAQAFVQNLWQNNQFTNQAAQQNKDIAAKKDLTQLQGGIDLQKIGAQTQGQLAIDAQAQEAALRQTTLKGQIDTSIAITNNDSQALQTAARNNTAAYQSYVTMITNIDNNPNLDAAAKTTAKREIGDSFVGYLRLSGAAADADFQSIVDGIFNAGFQPTSPAAPTPAPAPAPSEAGGGH